MTEYGLFNDEGCVERGFWSEGEAREAFNASDPEDELQWYALCDEHEEQRADTCEECWAEVDA